MGKGQMKKHATPGGKWGRASPKLTAAEHARRENIYTGPTDTDFVPYLFFKGLSIWLVSGGFFWYQTQWKF